MGFLVCQQKITDSASHALGGKAHKLYELGQKGFSVPLWAVIPVIEIQKRWHEGELILTPLDETQIQTWLQEHGLSQGAKFIVRSSAKSEDGAEQSFAGIFESFPNLSTVLEVKQAINKCVESFFSQRALMYGAGSESSLPDMAVVIQRCVVAEKAGVMFTADPSTGCREQLVISALYGHGEGVVGGEYNCDEYKVRNYPFHIEKNISEKTSFLSMLADSGLQKVRTPKSDIHSSVLSDEEISQLAELGKKIDLAFSEPQDIEWVFESGEIFIVQTRPITSLGDDRGSFEETIFDNSNIQESFNGLTLPLTFSYATEVYQAVYSRLMEVMGFSVTEVAEHDRRHGKMLGLIYGKVFYNINSWYKGLLLMPSFGKNKTDMEAMMGLENPVEFVDDQKLTFQQKLVQLPKVVRLMIKMIWSFATLESRVKKFQLALTDSHFQVSPDEMRWQGPQQLHENFLEKRARVLKIWTAPIINDFYVMIFGGKVRRVLEQIDEAYLFSAVVSGADVESLKPTLRLIELAQVIRQNEELLASLNLQPDQFISKLQANPLTAKLLDQFLDFYGDRVPGELKLETLTYRQEPTRLVPILKSFVEDNDVSVDSFCVRCENHRTTALKKVSEKINKKLGRRSLKKFLSDLKKAQKGIEWRESMRLDRTRTFGMARSVYLALGLKLKNKGLLESQSDIFYLTTEEVDQWLNGKTVFDSPAQLICLRKSQYKVWANKKLSQQVSLTSGGQRVQDRIKDVQNQGSDLKGIGCFPGSVKGEVMVVTDPTQVSDLKGKILVTERTDPGWTPLFFQIKGLLVEKGSALSHSAVVAREMGIPTVVNVPGLLNQLKSGDLVEFDGELGQILKLNEEKLSLQPEMEL